MILTAVFDAASAAVFRDLRDRYFPPRLNIVPAHLTLFHHLPGEALRSVDAELRALCAERDTMPFETPGLRFLGRGVAVEIEAKALVVLRSALAGRWSGWLTKQDMQGFKPHVTIQNKVAPQEARRLFDHLAATHRPMRGVIVGLDLWHYRGGPWEPAGCYRFDAAHASVTRQ